MPTEPEDDTASDGDDQAAAVTIGGPVGKGAALPAANRRRWPMIGEPTEASR